jgi:hypothetical protein
VVKKVSIEHRKSSFAIPPLKLGQSHVEHYTAIRKGRYKHYFEMGTQYAMRNIEYIFKAFMERTPRTDVATFVTCAVDSASFKPLL